MSQEHVIKIASELVLRPQQVAATAELLEGGATIPFIARYRKEVTGSLDEVAITAIRDRLNQLKELDDRRQSIIKSLEERELLTDELKEKITDEKFMMFIAHPDADEYERMLAGGQVPEKVNLMIPIISNLDPTTAPPGRQLIIAGSLLAIKPDWKAWETAVMNSVRMVFPDIEEHILFTEATSPETVDKLVGEKGAVIGLAQTVDQVGSRRISQKTPVQNLYLVGSEAGGWGIGTELAANSALELNAEIGVRV